MIKCKEHHVHTSLAAKGAGLRLDIIEAIRDGRRSCGMSADEEIVYGVSAELHKNKRVSDRTFARGEQRFGEPVVVDLVGINGYYTLQAMELNGARYPLPKDGTPLPRLPE